MVGLALLRKVQGGQNNLSEHLTPMWELVVTDDFGQDSYFYNDLHCAKDQQSMFVETGYLAMTFTDSGLVS